MAGNLYRSGQQAVTELRDTYAQSRVRGLDNGYDSYGNMHIPGAFPNADIMVQGNEQLVLFPSYAKRHARKQRSEAPAQGSLQPQGSLRDGEYWRQEWERNEEEKAVVDVDVMGWIYSPSSSPMTRRNRIMIGLARQLSGISLPKSDLEGSEQPQTHHQQHEEKREHEKIAHEAARIEQHGKQEKDVASQGGYVDKAAGPADSGTRNVRPLKSSRSWNSRSEPSSPTLSAQQSAVPNDMMSDAELAMANANLMARLAPFLTSPLVAVPITIFFYDENNSQTRTVMTNDAGHFIVRAPLEFVPTHVRVLANENLSASKEIQLIEPHGVSVISDIDDTIKRSNISGGAREIFRNTFVRDLADLTIDGVKEWYNNMASLGVSFHYCSNSPWQLFPVLASFFKVGDLPPGSLHLKQYSGMLQGIFEPVAERKKSTLFRLMRDFPERKFLLIGDSGEADLEVYTELALNHPERILAVFIRDVTTPEDPTFFGVGFEGPARRQAPWASLGEPKPRDRSQPQKQYSASDLPAENQSSGPLMGTLIDFSEEPQEVEFDNTAALSQLKTWNPRASASSPELAMMGQKKPPPPRPSKPIALRSTASRAKDEDGRASASPTARHVSPRKPPPPPARKPVPDKQAPQPLTKAGSNPQQPLAENRDGTTSASKAPRLGITLNPTDDRPPPPLPRRRGASSRDAVHPQAPPPPTRSRNVTSSSDSEFESLPPSASGPPAPPPRHSRPSNPLYSRGSSSRADSPSTATVNKKTELWRRRVARAHEQLDRVGVVLYTWRRGQDVVEEAMGIVRRALEEMQQQKGRQGGR